MAQGVAESLALKAYRARAVQFLDGLRFPATKEQILAHFARRNTPMELIEDTLTLSITSFTTRQEFAAAVTEIHARRAPHTWTSREWTS